MHSVYLQRKNAGKPFPAVNVIYQMSADAKWYVYVALRLMPLAALYTYLHGREYAWLSRMVIPLNTTCDFEADYLLIRFKPNIRGLSN